MALRETSCVMERDTCGQCTLRRECAYGYLFETPIVASDAVMRLYTQAPHPFVIEAVPPSDSSVRTGQTGRIRMVLIGEAFRFLPYIFLAFQRLGKRGLGRDAVPFEILRIQDEHHRTLYDGTGTAPKLDALHPRHLYGQPRVPAGWTLYDPIHHSAAAAGRRPHYPTYRFHQSDRRAEPAGILVALFSRE